LTAEVHAPTDARGPPVGLALTPGGQTNDSRGAAMLLNNLTRANVALGDKAPAPTGSAPPSRPTVQANIPDRITRKQRPWLSKVLYRERNHIERFFNRTKHARRIAAAASPRTSKTMPPTTSP